MKILNKAVKLLSKVYSVEQFDDNAFGISFHKGEAPFALIISEDDSPTDIFLAVDVSAPDPFSIANIALELSKIAPTQLAEPYYMDAEGELFWSELAYKQFSKRSPADPLEGFLNSESPSKYVN